LLLFVVWLQFGRLMRYLESSKLADNTYIMVSGDNGERAGDNNKHMWLLSVQHMR
jgi:arylsulfatase A-like enzyme